MLNFANQIDDVLLGNQRFVRVARDLREKVIQDPQFANDIRWRPAYKQILFRDDKGRLVVTISQNSVGNAITELLGIVVKRQVDSEAYAAVEEGLGEPLAGSARTLASGKSGRVIVGTVLA